MRPEDSRALVQWKDDNMEQRVLSAAARTLRRCSDRKAISDACMLNQESTVVGERHDVCLSREEIKQGQAGDARPAQRTSPGAEMTAVLFLLWEQSLEGTDQASAACEPLL